jgi:uncharacterized membrane protein (UPF0127 family)
MFERIGDRAHASHHVQQNPSLERIELQGRVPAEGDVEMVQKISKVVNARTGNVVGDSIAEAVGPWQSFKGLMFREELPAGHGLIFRPARGIHTHFMRFPIDLVFFDKTDTVTKVRPAMAPWRFDFTNAGGVIELNAGTAAASDIRPGDQLRFTPV